MKNTRDALELMWYTAICAVFSFVMAYINMKINLFDYAPATLDMMQNGLLILWGVIFGLYILALLVAFVCDSYIAVARLLARSAALNEVEQIALDLKAANELKQRRKQQEAEEYL